MPVHTLENKVVAITGGTRGIGLAVAARLLEEGAKVAICGTRQETVDAATAVLSGKGLHDNPVLGRVADVSKRERAEEFISTVHERFGRIDALINNAGVGTFRPVAELTPEEWDRMIALNLSGVYYCCHAVLPIYKQQGSGDIVNMSSLAGRNSFAGGAGYNASKFGLNGFSEAMMLDHRQDGVRVSCIMPGSVATGFGRSPATGFGQSGASGTGVTSKETGANWKIAPADVAEVVVMLLNMPPRTTISRVEIRPSRPSVKVT